MVADGGRATFKPQLICDKKYQKLQEIRINLELSKVTKNYQNLPKMYKM